MPNYEVRSTITREEARALMLRLIADEDFRADFEANPREILAENGIEVGDETLPDQVTLPDVHAMRLFLDLLETRGLAPESASPFAFALMVMVLGAMPVLASDRAPLDGAG